MAARLLANYLAQDWARGWGLGIYSPKIHGRDEKRRKALAVIILAVRDGRVGYDTEAGALMRAWLKP